MKISGCVSGVHFTHGGAIERPPNSPISHGLLPMFENIKQVKKAGVIYYDLFV
jgi:hypothetical protein